MDDLTDVLKVGAGANTYTHTKRANRPDRLKFYHLPLILICTFFSFTVCFRQFLPQGASPLGFV